MLLFKALSKKSPLQSFSVPDSFFPTSSRSPEHRLNPETNNFTHRVNNTEEPLRRIKNNRNTYIETLCAIIGKTMSLEAFIENVTNEHPFEHTDGTDIWHFHRHQKVIFDNSNYLKIATSQDGSDLMVVDNNDELRSKNLYMINEGYLSYYCFSLVELFYRKNLIKTYDKLRKSKSIDYSKLLEEFRVDSGCLYWIASGTMTNAFDTTFYDEKRNRVAIKMLTEVAEQNDPRACSEVASYYSMEGQNSELTFYFLKKAIIKGDYLSKKKLVEFIIEEHSSEIELALTVLTELKDLAITNAWAYYSEANIFLKGIGVPRDLKRGLLLLDTAAGYKHPMAMADYAYFLFNGIGIGQDQGLAKKLALEANKLTNGRFDDILKRMN